MLSYHAVGIERQPLQSQQRVIRLHYDVATFGLIGEHRIGLDQLLRISFIQLLQKVRPHAGACAASDRMDKHESLPIDRKSQSQ